jgi:streptogramin lyase
LEPLAVDLSLFDPQTEKFERMPDAKTPSGEKSNVVWTIYPDVSQKLWIGTWGAGLHLFDPETREYEYFDITEKGIKSNNSVLSICRDYQGFIWVGTYGDGLKRVNPLTKEVQHFRKNDQNRQPDRQPGSCGF